MQVAIDDTWQIERISDWKLNLKTPDWQQTQMQTFMILQKNTTMPLV